jgi:hypothetical protein
MPRENYSHIGVMEKHMVGGDGLGDEGGEDQPYPRNEDRGALVRI